MSARRSPQLSIPISPALRRLAGGGAALLLIGALAGCGGDSRDTVGGAGSTEAEETSSAAATTAAEDSDSPQAEDSASASAGASASAAEDDDEASSIPMMAMHEVVEDHGSVDVEGYEGPWHLNAESLQDTAIAAFGATGADCPEEIFTGHPVTCVIHDQAGEGSVDGMTFTAFPVNSAGKNMFGVLFVQGDDPLSTDLTELVMDPDSGVSGIETGVEWIAEDRDPQAVAEDVRSVVTSEQAMLAWGLPDDDIQSLTCSDGLIAQDFSPAHCSLDFAEGLHGDVTVLPAQWAGAGAEPGPLVIVNGTD